MSTWVLLRGLARESRHWGSFPQTLRNHLPDAHLPDTHVVSIDLPGNGRFWRQRSPSSIDAMVEHCRQQLAELAIDPPYNLAALSLGGMVAAAWCVQYPHEIARGVLINTSFRTFSPFWQRLRPNCYLTLLRLMLVSKNALRREQQVLRLTSNAHADDERVAERWAHYATESPLSLRNVCRQIFAASQFRAPAAAPCVPLLILASRGDRLVNPHCSQQIAKQWNVPLALHPTAGHDLPLDDSAWVIQQIVIWGGKIKPT